ncbi:MAG: hypothetical protein AAGJ50_03590 [Pseudomonadota bacterium]
MSCYYETAYIEEAREAAKALANAFDALHEGLEARTTLCGVFDALEDELTDGLREFTEEPIRAAFYDTLAEWGKGPTLAVLEERKALRSAALAPARANMKKALNRDRVAEAKAACRAAGVEFDDVVAA